MRIVLAVFVLLWAAGCRSVGPMTALESTIPLSAEREQLSYIGEASGKACQETLLWLIPLDSDSSIYRAKEAALLDASTRYQRRAVALIDVSIDVENLSWLVWTRVCTWVRGKALGPAAPPAVAMQPAPASPPRPAEAPPTQPVTAPADATQVVSAPPSRPPTTPAGTAPPAQPLQHPP